MGHSQLIPKFSALLCRPLIILKHQVTKGNLIPLNYYLFCDISIWVRKMSTLCIRDKLLSFGETFIFKLNVEKIVINKNNLNQSLLKC